MRLEEINSNNLEGKVLALGPCKASRPRLASHLWQVPSCALTTLSLILWKIWDERNAKIFRDTAKSPKEVPECHFNGVISLVAKWSTRSISETKGKECGSISKMKGYISMK
uniref:Uncharacterized protein n=1 Tax=Cucumis melo TaxID=3656 RepID=A0A9I9E4R6_CUCME